MRLDEVTDRKHLPSRHAPVCSQTVKMGVGKGVRMNRRVLLVPLLLLLVASCVAAPTATPTTRPTVAPVLAISPVPTLIATATEVPTSTVTPAPTSTPTPTPPTLSELARAYGIDIGITVGRDEKWQDPRYKDVVLKNATIIIPAGEFMQTTMDVHGEHLADPFINWAVQNNKKLRIHELFWHQDIGNELKQIVAASKTTEELRQNVLGYMDRRIRRVLNIIPSQVRKTLPLEIVFANEAMWYYHPDQRGGYSGSPETGGLNTSPYFYTLGPQWLTEAYVKTYQIAGEMGFDQDSIKLIYNDYDIELPGPKAELIKRELAQRKQEIAQRLGIPVEDVQLYIGMQFHLKAPGHQAQYRLDAGRLDKQILITHFEDMAKAIGPVVLTEIDYEGDKKTMPVAISILAEACLEAGPDVCTGLSFWGVLYHKSAEGCTLFSLDDFTPTDAHNRLMQILSQQRPPATITPIKP